MVEQDYLSLVRTKDHHGLADAWDQAVNNPGEVEIYCQTVTELCDRNQHGTALDLGARMVDALEQKQRLDDALRLAITLIRKEAANEGFLRSTLTLIEKRCGDESWYPLIKQLSGLSVDRPGADAFAMFERARRMAPGCPVNHRAGWNEGLVRDIDASAETITVAFAEGSERTFPLAKAIETLRPLDPEDVRAMRLQQPEELERIASEEPARLIRMSAKIFRGTISSTQLKNELSPSVIPQKKWAGWWKKAKTAASNDPWLEVSGAKTRPIFELRRQPVTLTDEAEKRVGHCQDVPEVIQVTREYLARGLGQVGQDKFLDLAQARIENELQADSDTPAHLLDGILFLAEHGRSTSVAPASELRKMLMDDEGQIQPEAFENLSSAGSREHAVTLLPEAIGDGWIELCLGAITRFPASEVEPVVNLLVESKAGASLAAAWPLVAPFPRKHPTLTYMVARLFADGVLEGQEQAPDQVSAARVVLHLARVIAKERKSSEALNKLRARVTNLLVGRRALLGKALEEASRDELAAFLGIAERGGSEFPQEVTDNILRVVANKFPDLTKKPERPFWEDDSWIYVTAKGLSRQKEDHRILVDEKIPLNAQAINAAASYGDLSENAEWDAAMEEQRNLTGRAQEMSIALRRVRLIEDQYIPEGVVSPGTRVRFTYLDDSTSGTMRILGPWDCTEEDIINYRAPLAAGLLGTSVGDEATITLPGGERPIRIDAVETIVGENATPA